MSQAREPERQIPSVSTDDAIQLWKGYTINDALIVGSPVFIALVSMLFLPEAFILSGVITSALLVIVGIIIVETTPDYYTSTEWIVHHFNHVLEPNEVDNIKYHSDQPRRDQQVELETNPVTKALASTQRAQDTLGIKRVYPPDEYGPGAVEQTDGTLIAALRVYPANLTLATGEDWRQATTSLTQTMNTLDYPVKFYYTNRPFDVEGFLDPFQDRLTDTDVQNQPALEEVVDSFLSWFPDQLEQTGTTRSEHYLIVGVEEPEMTDESQSTGIKAQLADKPVFSWFLNAGDDEDETPEAVIRGRQRAELYDRISTTESRVREIRGIDTEIIGSDTHAELISRAWTRSDTSIDLNTTPIVHHEQEREINEQSTEVGE